MRTPWDTFERETLANLRELIRLDTTNPPGNERIATDFIAATLGRCGIEATVIESAPARASLIARVAGRDRAKPPLMLSSHTDVVPVEAERWTHGPFDAELADGCIWGRGSIDMKSKCATDLGLLLALTHAGVAPERGFPEVVCEHGQRDRRHGARSVIHQALPTLYWRQRGLRVEFFCNFFQAGAVGN